jgi:hypothetical protein
LKVFDKLWKIGGGPEAGRRWEDRVNNHN